jgi:hypothetical protein
MRLALAALAAILLLSAPALAQDDNAIDDLTLVTAQPRAADVKMVVQTLAPPEKTVKTAAK